MPSHVLEREFLRENFVPITVDSYHYLAEKNLISENSLLIEGVIFEKEPKSPIAFDRDKADIYTSAKIPEYWIFNLQNKTLGVFQNPSNDKYQLTTVLTVADSIQPLFQSEILLDLKEFL